VTAERPADADVDALYDALYGVPPEQFMALRKELVAAAKKRGDVDAARVIGAARRPTAAAWVVNVLVRNDATARTRLGELTDALRAAHSAMDGSRIRELTAVQRKLIDGLVRAGLAAAGHDDPTAALRNDVTDTLAAAVADPDVAARLGRLEKAERWSGFGDFGMSSAVGSTARREPAASSELAAPARDEADAEQARERVSMARREVDAAEQAHTEAAATLSKRTTAVATARRRYEKLLETLNAAEREVDSADASREAAEQDARETSKRLELTKAELAQAQRTLGDVTG
jgi:hypothetical protein